ncbi:ABC transporter ATP-binding protein/permease [Neomicrococcus aestuarii]|nr:ATP-binding cassette domain-containing protein [Neomicrococcus aestuarii]
MTALLSLSQVSRPYGEQLECNAVSNISLDIAEGEFVAVIGSSGSGKSTLLNILGLLDEQWTGSYELEGVDIKALTSRQKDTLRGEIFGFVFQSSYLDVWATAIRNVSSSLSARGASIRSQREVSLKALEIVGLAHKASSIARYLSGGERQRIAIARAISTHPRILLADEPTGNLDSVSTMKIMELFRELNAQGTTVIMVTHDDDVAAHADRVITLRDGLLADDTATASSHSDGATENTASITSAVNSEVPKRVGYLRRATFYDRLARAVNSATSRPVRSLALALAFGLAITGLVIATGLGASASLQVSERISESARDEVRVNVPVGMHPQERARWKEKISSLERVNAVGELGVMEGAMAQPSRTGGYVGPSPISASVYALDASALNLFEAKISPVYDVYQTFRTNEHVALVGSQVAKTIGVSGSSFGQEIWVAQRPFTVVGIVTSSSNENFLEHAIVIPLQEDIPSNMQLIAKTEMGYPAAVAEAVPFAVSPGNPGGVNVATVGDLRNLRMGVAGDLQGLLLWLSISVLLLAIFSVSAAMFLTVQTRTQELALARSQGMSPVAVGTVFVVEGAVLGLAGALAGVSLGLLGCVGVSAWQGWTAVVPWTSLVAAPFVGVVAGSLSAAIPAWKAAMVDPADGIR